MQSYQEEIFGPVLQVVRADNLEEAARCQASTNMVMGWQFLPVMGWPRVNLQPK